MTIVGSVMIKDLAFSYAGNLSALFTVYLLVSMATVSNLTRVMTAMPALLVVESFEFMNGFGIMTNVYYHFDYLANAIGIELATGVDAGISRVLRPCGRQRKKYVNKMEFCHTVVINYQVQ